MEGIKQYHYSFDRHIVLRYEPYHYFFILQREEIEQLVLNKQKSLHEIVPTNHPCHLFFDIDFYLNEKQTMYLMGGWVLFLKIVAKV